jgi:hypothetical protein
LKSRALSFSSLTAVKRDSSLYTSLCYCYGPEGSVELLDGRAFERHAKANGGREGPSVKTMVGREGERTTANYAFHYRMASQTVHEGVLGMRDVIQESGIRFDGREANPNLALLFLASYLLPFL